MAGVLGFEPRYAGIKTLCLNHLATPQKSIHSVNMKQTNKYVTLQIFRYFEAILLDCQCLSLDYLWIFHCLITSFKLPPGPLTRSFVGSMIPWTDW